MEAIITQSIVRTKTQTEKKEQAAQASQTIITIACLSFFPLMYFVGKAVMMWIG